MARVYVKIPRRVGDYRVDTGGMSWSELAASGAGLGATLGSVVPGIGNAVGSFVGGAGGAIASFFGFRSGRDEVRDVMRKIIDTMVSSVWPGEITHVGSARDIPVLPDALRPDDVRAILQEIKNITLEQMEPGSDIYNDLARGFSSISFSTTLALPGHYTLLAFERAAASTYDAPHYSPADADLEPEPGTGSIPDQTDTTDASTSNTAVDPDRPGGISPAVFGLAAVVAVVILAR